jgi:hypothetical protein
VCHVVASDSTTKRQTALCRTFVLSLTMLAKWSVVVRHVVAMSHFPSAQIEGLAYKPSDKETSRQRAVWRALLETRRQCDDAPGLGAFQ